MKAVQRFVLFVVVRQANMRERDNTGWSIMFPAPKDWMFALCLGEIFTHQIDSWLFIYFGKIINY